MGFFVDNKTVNKAQKILLKLMHSTKIRIITTETLDSNKNSNYNITKLLLKAQKSRKNMSIK